MAGLPAGSAIDRASFTIDSSEPPFTTAKENITADPANNAARVRAVGLQRLGGADE
jgi:hypothetical protein